MAERALLLIECIANYTEGSNPSHSLKTVSLTKTEIRGAIKVFPGKQAKLVNLALKG